MPIYEYECRKCKQRHEIMQKMSDEPLTTCEGCGGELYRVISPSGLSFKGAGWYLTDYARKGKDSDSQKGPTTPSETPSTTSSEKTGEKKTEKVEKKEAAPSPSIEKSSEKKDTK